MLTVKRELLFLIPVVVLASLFLRQVFLAELPPPRIIPQFIEAQTLAVKPESSVTNFTIQNTTAINPGKFSADDFIYFTTRKIGDSVTFLLTETDAGHYKFKVHFAKSADFGKIDIFINQQLAFANIDLFSPVTEPEELDLEGTYQLQGTADTIQFKISDTNPESHPSHYQFGIDGLVITPVAGP